MVLLARRIGSSAVLGEPVNLGSLNCEFCTFGLMKLQIIAFRTRNSWDHFQRVERPRLFGPRSPLHGPFPVFLAMCTVEIKGLPGM